jgi:transcriptional regulator with XRE-family HTH domain
MQKDERMVLRQELDREQRWFQKAGRGKVHRSWLRDVRKSLEISMVEFGEMLKMKRAALYRLEQQEKKGTLTIQKLEKAAKAMDCKLVYCIVPDRGTLDLKLRTRQAHKRKTDEWRRKGLEEAIRQVKEGEQQEIARPGSTGILRAEARSALAKLQAALAMVGK